jgi:predicted nucleic acid-binding protein
VTLVLDASAAVDLLLRTPRGEAVQERLEREMIAPELLDVEVTSACARLVRAGQLSSGDAATALAQLSHLPVARLRHAELVEAAWSLRDRVRIADGFYVACALAFACPLLSCDARLECAAVPGLSVYLVR